MCAKYYAEKKHSNITNYEWRANSLNPFNSEVKKKYGALTDVYKLVRNNPKNWVWGEDNTGDITRVKNIKWIRKYIYTKWLINKDKPKEHNKLDLIIGDGGMSPDTNSIYALQKLELAQVINVLAYSSIGGSCVIKHFTPYIFNKPSSIKATSFFISFIYLYYISFEEVNLFKPYTSDSTSGEFYIICKGFKGIEEKHLEKLYTILNNFKENYALFLENVLPKTFIIQINNFIKLLTNHTISGYKKQNYLLECYKDNINLKNIKKSNKLKKTNTTKTQSNNNINNVNCNIYLKEKEMENILIPRYKQWVNIYDFE